MNYEEEFEARVISAGRLTIPNHILSKMSLEETDSIQVKIRKRWARYPMFYKDKEKDKIEMVVIETTSPLRAKIAEEGRQILEGKSVDWAFYVPSSDWVIKPEET